MTTLNDGREMPQLGLGVFKVRPGEAISAVTTALQTGYRAIDTAAAYDNEAEVGQAIAASGLARDDVFVTTKLWNDMQGRDRAPRALADSLERLGMDAVDLYLIHWPVPTKDRQVETWEALVALRDQGLARSIGVSNFRVEDLRRIIDATGVVPATNQIELHPYFQQAELRAFHAEHGIATTAWAPLAQGGDVLDDPAVTGIAAALGCTPAQVVLRWHLQLGNVVIPKSVTPSRIAENFAARDVELDDEAMRAIGALDRPDGRVGPDPAVFALGA